ncbi:MAG: tetratricopeptide repeat protein, partial [Candidatus Heimdallarchaeota archaeon]|nr:tetratricopeptide repeat protein [Candidatus Heimdallarchaeota archaeon]
MDRGEFNQAELHISQILGNQQLSGYLQALPLYYKGLYTDSKEKLYQENVLDSNSVQINFRARLLLSKIFWRNDLVKEAISQVQKLEKYIDAANLDDGTKEKYRYIINTQRCKILMNVGRTDYRLYNSISTDKFDEIEKECRIALSYYQKQNDTRLIFEVQSVLAFILHAQGSKEDGLKLLETNLEYTTKSEKKYLQADTLQLMGTYLMAKFMNNEKAKECFEKSLQLRKEIDDRRGIARSHDVLGIYYQDMANIIDSMKYLESAKNVYRDLNNPLQCAWMDYKIALTYLWEGQVQKALEVMLETIVEFQKSGSITGIAINTTRIGSMYANLERFEEAEEYHKNSLDISNKLDYINGAVPMARHNLGLLYRTNRKLDLAENMFELALQDYKKCGYMSDAQALHDLGEVFRLKGQYEKAIRYYLKSLEHTSNRDKNAMSDFFDSISCYYAILIGTQSNYDVDLTPFISRLENLTFDIIWTRSPKIVGKALYLMKQPRVRDHYKAQEMLEEYVDANLPFLLIVGFTGEILLISLLIQEYQTSGNIEILEKSIKYIDDLLTKTIAHNQLSLTIETKIIQSKLQQALGDFEGANSILEEALIIAKENELNIDVKKIQLEITNLSDEFQKHQQLIDKNIDLKKKMKEVKIMEYITKAKEHMTKLSL